VLVSDRKYGLAVIEFNGTRAGYLTGTIKNANDGSSVSGVKVELLNRYAGEGKSAVLAQNAGEYLVSSKPGTRSFKFSKFGFEDFVLSDFAIAPGVTHVRDIVLTPNPSFALQVNVKTREGQAVANARVIVTFNDFRSEIFTASDGTANFSLPAGNYQIALREWGYVPASVAHQHGAASTIELTTEPGYVETFTDAEPWSTSATGDDSFQEWLITRAADRPYGTRLPESDHTGDAAGMAAITRARLGKSTLTSPVMDATKLMNPYLQFARFYNPYAWSFARANDTLQVWLSNDNGATWKPIAAYTAIDQTWQVLSYRVADFITPSAQMRVKFVNNEAPDNSQGASAFGMIDDVKLISERTMTGVEQPNAPPRSLQLLVNYPNPFNPSTKIRWQQEGFGAAEILLFDVMGRRVATYRVNDVSSGLREYEIDLGNSASGVYLYQVHVNGTASEMKKMLLAK
jgi:hypothetical protein